MRRRPFRIALWLVALAVVALFVVFLFVRATAPAYAGGDPDRSAWFKSLTVPNSTMSCCDVSDCRRTESEWRDDQWWSRVEFYDGKTIWVPIPPDRVLLQPKSLDGEAYTCSTRGSASYTDSYGNRVGPSGPYVFCFVPPDMGF